MLRLEPLHPLFAAEASGVDLRKPLAPVTVREIERAMDRCAVLVFRQAWRPGDSVMWDNRAVIHRGRPFDLSKRRELRRTTTEDVAAPG